MAPTIALSKRLVVAVAGLGVFAAGMALTPWALSSFVDSASADTATLSGAVDLAQVADDQCSIQASTPETANLVITQASGAPIAALPGPASGTPSTATATFTIEVCQLALAEGTWTLAPYDMAAGSAFNPYPYLLFQVRADGTSITGSTPMSAAAMSAANDGMGVTIPSVASGATVQLTVSIWLRHDAPTAAYLQGADVGFRISGQTVAGHEIVLTGTTTP